MKTKGLLKLKENVLRSLLIGFVIGGLPFFFNGEIREAIATFILIFLGAFMGNVLYDIIRFYFKYRSKRRDKK